MTQANPKKNKTQINNKSLVDFGKAAMKINFQHFNNWING